MDVEKIEEVAARLTRGQRNTILGLDKQFQVLGCAEPTARRLCVPTKTRPALAVKRKGSEWTEFALSADGLAVRNHLENTNHD